MQTLTRLSKLVIIAFSITCFALLVTLQDRSPVYYLDYSSTLMGGIPLVLQQITSAARQNYPVLLRTPYFSSNKSNSIWLKIGGQLNLDHATQNPRVQTEIRKILADKKSFQSILNRSAPYIYYIYTQAKNQHLPAELTLIPIIESEYNPNDRSSVGATGLWQLMPATARGLGINPDDRRNVIDSTNAALTYFNSLQKEFHGQWNMAFAAYNCGDGCVSSAIKKAHSNDYFNLKLPLETKLYVPRLLAVAEIIKHADKYGVVLPQIKDEPYFTKVEMNQSESLANYAKLTGTNLQVLQKLNPNFPSGKTSSHAPVLLVPADHIRKSSTI